jgi:hypothetical protein
MKEGSTGRYSLAALTATSKQIQCLSFKAPPPPCCSLSQQFSLRFNDSQSLPATPCDMNATWKRQHNLPAGHLRAQYDTTPDRHCDYQHASQSGCQCPVIYMHITSRYEIFSSCI